MTNPIPQIAQAETLLVQQVRALTAALGTVAGNDLDTALADLTRAATDATDRVEGARQFIALTLRPVLAAFANLSGDLAMGRAVNLAGEQKTTSGEQKTTAPAPTAIGAYPYVEAPLERRLGSLSQPITPEMEAPAPEPQRDKCIDDVVAQANADEVERQWEHYVEQHDPAPEPIDLGENTIIEDAPVAAEQRRYATGDFDDVQVDVPVEEERPAPRTARSLDGRIARDERTADENAVLDAILGVPAANSPPAPPSAPLQEVPATTEPARKGRRRRAG